ncbi:MAG TPA: hypothetical protein VFD62_08175 [Pyrinomonadaceae bacterium]|nr:hypothetical protein [Pyrinomonadaceae bacterium]
MRLTVATRTGVDCLAHRQSVSSPATILASGEKSTWGCSARTDCVDDELLELMASAGCTGIFFGIETGCSAIATRHQQEVATY